jgi:type I restriction enzyme S subunit
MNYKQKLTNLENLKKSILQKAFAGALTSPERTQYSKDGRSPSDETQTNKNPERVT